MAADVAAIADDFATTEATSEAATSESFAEFKTFELLDVSLFSADSSDPITWLQESKGELAEVDMDSIVIDVDSEASDKAFYMRSFSTALDDVDSRTPDDETVLPNEEDFLVTVAYTGEINPEIYYSLPTSGLSDVADSLDNIINDFQWEWHNAVFPTDVDGDGSVAPNDALLVIDLLTNFGRAAIFSLQETSMSSLTLDNQKYFDVNHDDEITPSDVLMIIEYLGENPQVAGDSLASTEASDDHASLFAPEVGRIAQAISDDGQLSFEDTKETFEYSEEISLDLFATRIADPDWVEVMHGTEDSYLAKIRESDSDIIDLAISDDELFDSVA